MSGLGEKMLRLHVSVYATAVPLLVRLPLRTVLRLSEPPKWFRPYRRVRLEQILSVVQRRLSQPRMMRRRACLRQGLVLYHFLRMAGLDARLHFSLHPQEDSKGNLHGHCWVSVDGKPITEPAGEEIVALGSR